MMTLVGLDHRCRSLPVHAAGAGGVADGRRGLRGAVVLSRAQGLVADGRRHLARGAARHRASPISSTCRWRSAPSWPASSCALFTGYLKENSRVKEDTVMGIVFSGMFGLGLVIFTKVETDQHLLHILFGNVLGVTVRDLIETAIVAGGTLRHRPRQAARSPALLLRSEPCPHHRPAGARAALRIAGAAVAHHRRVAQGGRHHPGHRHADRPRRHRLSPDRQLRAHAGDRHDRRDRVGRARHHRRASTSTARPAPASC